MNGQAMSIMLMGPGGSGKTSIGALIAARLGMAFVDLDRRFQTRAGDISEYMNRFGYRAYARENVESSVSLLSGRQGHCVAALSSGFMTYPRSVHPAYMSLRRDIERRPSTFVLIPSLDLDMCVAETVRRQIARPFARANAQEEAVIRERFPVYIGLRARKIETMRPLTAIVDDLFDAIRTAPADVRDRVV